MDDLKEIVRSGSRNRGELIMNEIIKLSLYGISLSVNEHRTYRETVEQFLDPEFCGMEMPEDILQMMIATDTVIKLQAYPKSLKDPIIVYHYDYTEAIETMKWALSENEKGRLCPA